MNIWFALGQNFAVLVAVMIMLWLISVRIRDVSFIDSFWAYGMALMASVSILQIREPGPMAWAIWALTAFWGLRLGTYLFLRWRREGIDPRYVKIMGYQMDKKGKGFARAALVNIWGMQILLLFFVCMPAQLGILLAGNREIGLVTIIGTAIAVIGILLETIGDAQLKAFRANPANKGKVLDTGLWKYTRHPNYFGDFCAWWGIWLAATPIGWPVWIAIVGPLFLSFTLMKWSGVTLLEKGMQATRPKYDEYKRKTNAFFPGVPKQ